MQNLDRFAQLFSREFSGLRAKRTVGQLTQLHRIQASPGLLAAVDLMRQAAEAAGLANVQVHCYPVDGKSYWWTWKKPWFWSPQSAVLRLLAPEAPSATVQPEMSRSDASVLTISMNSSS
jgi:hypothetical protein